VEDSKRGKRKTKDPCQECGLHKNLCICAFIPKIEIDTKILLLIHKSELARTTNSGRLAVKALTNSKMLIRGDKNHPLNLSNDISPDNILDKKYQSLLFFPSKNAVPLTKEFVSQHQWPIQLIVPDGNWRQASKVQNRHIELKDIPHVMISKTNKAQYHLRKEHSPEGMSTLEAIACALEIIEGPHVYESLMALYHKKLEHTLIGRGIKL
jgi:DTW domain-containing protein